MSGTASFWQIFWVVLIGCTVITGGSFTVTVTSFVNGQPSELALVSVYTVVIAGDAITVLPVVEFRSVDGLQVYPPLPPVPTRFTDDPSHINGADGAIFKILTPELGATLKVHLSAPKASIIR